ncbi:hypothetical protein AQUCO_04200196v1 [Aquilegia coerulea]|uniref:Uncharacterized protein n=1 Tax=Aquilegia coerulea TaxID=218851 RepID=A0A2G5CPM5_AQUCA|nr:hypothetical protein AQUCO_04200196v1 [Aquilegia coerulea]
MSYVVLYIRYTISSQYICLERKPACKTTKQQKIPVSHINMQPPDLLINRLNFEAILLLPQPKIYKIFV